MGCKQSVPKEVVAETSAPGGTGLLSACGCGAYGDAPTAAGYGDAPLLMEPERNLPEERSPILPAAPKAPPKVKRSETWAANLGGARKNRLLGLLRSKEGTPSDVWMQASFDVQLQKLMQEHPYLEEDGSSQPHPLQTWTSRCRESNDSRRFAEAQRHMHRLKAGLKAEQRPIIEAFRRFDLDSSGHIDPAEFRHMCAYLGWGEEDSNLMDLDKDGRVTLPDFQAFVGHMGGVHELFEKRRLRITKSRKDVCDYAGIAVGALVRSHFYVRGQKSHDWKEARVVAVGVSMGGGGGGIGPGPSVLGVLLEFGFGPADRWKTRQVVPTHWVLGGVEDASVAAALREVGILDEQQCFWALLLPDSEMHAMRHLTDCQKAALKLCRDRATASHESALVRCRERFKELGYGEIELQAVLGWVQDLAPVIIHLDIDDVGRLLETDEFYRSQSETKSGEEDDALKETEAGLFGNNYADAKPFERVKYAHLNVMNDYRGVSKAAKPGNSYLVLKDVRLRCTFTAGESAGRTVDDIAVLDKYAHVLAQYSDPEIKGLISVATGAIASEREGGLPTSGAARLTLLRGSSEDPTTEWVTFGFPGLEQRVGRYYYEVHLFAGSSSAQVGLLSPSFVTMPYVASTQGVGDDDCGWAVDGQNSAKWHGGSMGPWNFSWPSENPAVLAANPAAMTPWAGNFGRAGKVRVLSQTVVVGVGVDLEERTLRFATDGVWDEEVVFGPDSIPEGTTLFPAISCKGRAAFMFGPGEFKYAPPEIAGGKFLQWPSTPGGVVRIDSPDLGNSQILSLHKEVQIHGEVHLQRNVQRLVANDKYRVKPKTNRSFALIVTNAGICSGMYHRVGAHETKPLYKSSTGAVIYWDPKGSLWKMNSTENFTSCFGHAPADVNSPDEPPRAGWRLPDEAQGVLDKKAFESALEEAGLAKSDVNKVSSALTNKETGSVYRVNGENTLAKEWQKLKSPPITAEAAWEAAISSLQLKILREAGTSVGYPQLAEVGHVLETKHPYDAKKFTWTREVQFKDTANMSVYFSSKCCTIDQRTTVSILAGGLNKNAMGPGTRMELTGPSGKLLGTMVERLDGGQSFRVRLDPSKGSGPGKKAKNDWVPKNGEKVEARKDGEWHEAVLTGTFPSSDWYTGARTNVYLVEFTNDPEKLPQRKSQEELRKSWDFDLDPSAPVPETFEVELPEGENFAVCSEAAKGAIVKYGEEDTVGTEILSFKYEPGNVLAPIQIGSLASSGPAQDAGVEVGWSFDLAGTTLHDSRREMAKIIEGVGGFELPPKTSHLKGGRLNNAVMNKMLQAALSDPAEVVKRLNASLRSMGGVTLHFMSGVQGRILPEIHVRYEGANHMVDEIKEFIAAQAGTRAKPKPGPAASGIFGAPSGGLFGAPSGGGLFGGGFDFTTTFSPTPSKAKQVRPDGFKAPGPAQAAGVRRDWVVDLGKTRELNEGIMPDEVILENPNVLLGLKDVTMVFKQPEQERTVMFESWGPPDSQKWSCDELPGDSAEFQFSSDGDGVNEPDKRWGFWALVLPQGAPRLPMQVLDSLADKWVEVTSRATGIDKAPCCERDEWDDERLRTLCARHGWEFEWMTEDGERRRRANERQGFFLASNQLTSIREAAEARAALMAPGPEPIC